MVSSSEASSERLRALGIAVLDLEQIGRLPLYVDGADEATTQRHLIKGGGGALAREKIVAEASERFVCIVDDGKLVDRLGRFPLPVEVIPMARRLVAETIGRLGGRPVEREGFVTDNGNRILDVHDLVIDDPPGLEERIVARAVDVKRRRPADIVLVASADGVERIG